MNLSQNFHISSQESDALSNGTTVPNLHKANLANSMDVSDGSRSENQRRAFKEPPFTRSYPNSQSSFSVSQISSTILQTFPQSLPASQDPSLAPQGSFSTSPPQISSMSLNPPHQEFKQPHSKNEQIKPHNLPNETVLAQIKRCEELIAKRHASSSKDSERESQAQQDEELTQDDKEPYRKQESEKKVGSTNSQTTERIFPASNYEQVTKVIVTSDENKKQAQPTTKPKNIPGAIMLAIQKGYSCYVRGAEDLKFEFIEGIMKQKRPGLESTLTEFFRDYDLTLASWNAIIPEIIALNDQEVNDTLREFVTGLFAQENKKDFAHWFEKSKLSPQTKEYIQSHKVELAKEFRDDLRKAEERAKQSSKQKI